MKKKNLDRHFYERAVDLLRNIENVENNNVKNKMREIVEESLKVVMSTISNQKKKISP